MERATSSLRRGGALLWSIGTGHQQLNLIISELKSFKSHTKAVRDSQATVIHDIIDWACNNESRVLKEVVIHLIDLNSLYCEIQTQFAEQITEFRRQFEMILEGEKSIDAARNKFADCEAAEQKAKKKLKKLQKKEGAGDIPSIANKIAECERQREIAQAEVTQKVQENEAVKLMRVKEGILKLSEAYLALSNKCIYIFEAYRDIAKLIPDVEDREIHTVRADGMFNMKEILVKARERIKNYRSNPISTVSPRPPLNVDPPPPYSPVPYNQCPAFNPYFTSAREGEEFDDDDDDDDDDENNLNSGNNSQNASDPNASDPNASGPNAGGSGSSLYASLIGPNLTVDDLVGAMASAGFGNTNEK